MEAKKVVIQKSLIRTSLGFAMALVLASGVSALSREADRAREKLSKYEKTGETVSCLMSRRVDSTDALDDYSMLVEAGNDLYLNELNGRCSGLAREQRFLRVSPQARMCRGDIIRVIDTSGNQWGSCSLGKFQKLIEIEDAEVEQTE